MPKRPHRKQQPQHKPARHRFTDAALAISAESMHPLGLVVACVYQPPVSEDRWAVFTQSQRRELKTPPAYLDEWDVDSHVLEEVTCSHVVIRNPTLGVTIIVTPPTANRDCVCVLRESINGAPQLGDVANDARIRDLVDDLLYGDRGDRGAIRKLIGNFKYEAYGSTKYEFDDEEEMLAAAPLLLDCIEPAASVQIQVPSDRVDANEGGGSTRH